MGKKTFENCVVRLKFSTFVSKTKQIPLRTARSDQAVKGTSTYPCSETNILQIHIKWRIMKTWFNNVIS